MKVDENWKEVHVLAEDLDQILGIPTKTSERFLDILSKLIIHKFIEAVLTEEKSEYQITLPYLGSLIISVDEKHPKTDFYIRPSFYKAIREAYKTKTSPLTADCMKSLGETLIKRYDEGDELNG